MSQTTAFVSATHIWPADSDTPVAVPSLELDWGGAIGDRHHGTTMLSDVRQRPVFEKGTLIRNHRQLSIVDTNELARVAENLGIESLAPGVIADNIAVTGVPHLSTLTGMTRLVFSSGPVILIGSPNTPCTIAGAMVSHRYGSPAEAFPKAAWGLRGVTGWVEFPGTISVGDTVTVADYE